MGRSVGQNFFFSLPLWSDISVLNASIFFFSKKFVKRFKKNFKPTVDFKIFGAVTKGNTTTFFKGLNVIKTELPNSIFNNSR